MGTWYLPNDWRDFLETNLKKAKYIVDVVPGGEGSVYAYNSLKEAIKEYSSPNRHLKNKNIFIAKIISYSIDKKENKGIINTKIVPHGDFESNQPYYLITHTSKVVPTWGPDDERIFCQIKPYKTLNQLIEKGIQKVKEGEAIIAHGLEVKLEEQKAK